MHITASTKNVQIKSLNIKEELLQFISSNVNWRLVIHTFELYAQIKISYQFNIIFNKTFLANKYVICCYNERFMKNRISALI